jgi:CheY-like chemotaxis protein
VHVESEVGRGSSFSAYFPATVSVHGSGRPEASAPPIGRRELILVIDDEESIRQIASATLEANGYRVLSAGTGPDAVALFELHRTEVRAVLSDTMMPVMDGPATVRALRALAPQEPVIVTTGSEGESWFGDDPVTAVQAVVRKPYTRGDLLAALARVIRTTL